MRESETNTKGLLTLSCIQYNSEIKLVIGGTRREFSTYVDARESKNSNYVAELMI